MWGFLLLLDAALKLAASVLVGVVAFLRFFSAEHIRLISYWPPKTTCCSVQVRLLARQGVFRVPPSKAFVFASARMMAPWGKGSWNSGRTQLSVVVEWTGPCAVPPECGKDLTIDR